MRTLATLTAMAVALLAAGCGGAQRAQRVPDVGGERLDVAQAELDRVGLDHRTTGGGVFGVVVASRWWVCRQQPQPGVRDTSVLLIVSRTCHVPDVRGFRLSHAREMLDKRRLEVEAAGLGDERPVVEHRWVVCDQSPSPGEPATKVVLTVSRSC